MHASSCLHIKVTACCCGIFIRKVILGPALINIHSTPLSHCGICRYDGAAWQRKILELIFYESGFHKYNDGNVKVCCI